jgi:hypothetical protein
VSVRPTTRLCETHVCANEAAYVVHWPGHSIKLCEGCKRGAELIADAMGFKVTVDPLPRPEGPS